MKISNKKTKVLLLICGSIAAVRIPLLVSLLNKENYEVKCVLTKNTENIIQPLSLAILSRNNCFLDEDQWVKDQFSPLHINLSNWADIVLVAPLTATSLSKWVMGNAEGLVSSILIANQKPVIVAPAMNTNMWLNPAIQKNYQVLKTYSKVLIIQPEEGLLACDQFGIGKIPSNDLILLALNFVSSQNNNKKFDDLKDLSFLVTGGATSEKIDPARRITNNSSGAMGLVIAQAARFRGARVTYIHGPLRINSNLKEGIKSVEVETGKELKLAVKRELNDCDYLVMNAAVTDIKLSDETSKKIPKKDLKNFFSNNFEIVPDILQDINHLKKNNQIFIGFCAYTGDLENLRVTIKEKFNKKGCDLIFANPIDIEGQGFGANSQNQGWLFDKKGKEFFIGKTTKIDLANKFIDQIISINK